MGVGDKMKNAAEAAKGKAKEKTGDATDDRRPAGRGAGGEDRSRLEAGPGEKVKDAFKD